MVLYLIYNCINGFIECKLEKRNNQCEHGQPMEQKKGLFYTCDSGVARCQSHDQCHFWRMNSMFKAYCTGKSAWQLSIKFMAFMTAALNGFKNLKACFENVNNGTSP